MPDPNVARLHDWLKAHEDELLKDTVAVLQIDSIESEPKPDAPFGEGNRKALDFVLQRARDFGMKTTDLEGYIGYADFGQGERLVMTLGHLDVVPVGPGWKHAPFGGDIDGGYIYARGSNDDKGPSMAAFYAMRAIKECLPDLQSRMRVVFGCNEESGFKCVEHYMKTEEAPTYGVAPDSGWPLYHAEKGIANFVVTAEIPVNADFQILSVEGGQRPNIVIERCRAQVRVSDSVRKQVEEKVTDRWDKNVTATWNGDVLDIDVQGKAAHGANPFMGDNAATRLFRFLYEIAPFQLGDWLEDVLKMGQTSGAGIGVAGADEVSGELTCNFGIIKTNPTPNTQHPTPSLEMLFNLRYPVTWKGDQLADRCHKFLSKLKGKYSMKAERDSPSLYFPLDHPLVKTIVEVYEAETGEKREPGVMGGGTYARAIPNTVSIGTSWDGDGPAHENDERLAIDSLFKASRIYAHIFYRLAIMP